MIDARQSRWQRIVVALLLFFGVNLCCSADEPVTPTALTLPKSLEDLRQIYFYQSQLAELLPPNYRPIDIAELDAKLSALNQQTASPGSSPQLIRGVYVAKLVNDHLLSTQSFWDIGHDGEQPARLFLGNVGLALRVADVDPSPGSIGKLVSNFDGELSVRVKGDARLPFAWTLAGKMVDQSLTFDLRIPAAVQTRLLVEVPRDRQVIAIDGVSQSLPSPPPEADTTASASSPTGVATTWYSIDAGGLSRVRLRITSSTRSELQSVLPVRQASIQYELQPSSIRYTARMLVDSVAGTNLPVLSILNGDVTAVRIAGSAVPWTEVTTADGVGIRIDNSRVEASAGGGTINLTIDGEAAWNANSGAQLLPWPIWRNCRPVLVGAEMQAQLRLDSSLNAFRLLPPAQWKFSPTATAEDGSVLYRCAGPMVAQAPSVMVRPLAKQARAESLLRLTATATAFNAQWDTSVLVSNMTGPQPIQIRMDRNWNTELVVIPSSGRVIDLPNDPAQRRTLAVWPTADELVDGRFNLRITGTHPLRTANDRIEFPATAFATIGHCQNAVVALVTPPSGFNWTGDVALLTKRLLPAELTSFQRGLAGEPSNDSLLIPLAEGRTKSLVCRRPDISFDATSQLTLRVEGDRLLETFLVACNSTSNALQSVVIDLGRRHGRPPMQWSAIESDGRTRRIVSAAQVSPAQVSSEQVDSEQVESMTIPAVSGASAGLAVDAGGEEVWQVDFSNTIERGLMLVGRREYAVAATQSIALPSVPGAANQSAQVVVMPSLSVTKRADSTIKVHRLTAQKSQFAKFGDIATELEPPVGSMTLRYDTLQHAAIDVMPSRPADSIPIVWRENVVVTASNRGGDTLIATHDTASATALEIVHEVNLRLVSVTDASGNPLAYQEEPMTLRVPLAASMTVVTNWMRPVFSNSPARTWTPPRLGAVGVVFQRTWTLTAASDTAIPVSLLYSNPFADRVWLVDAGIVFALMAIVGLCVFAFGWWLAMHWPTITAIIWTASVTPVITAGDLTISWMATVCVPLAAGGLVALSLNRRATVADKRTSTALGAGRGNATSDSANQRRDDEPAYGSSHLGWDSWDAKLRVGLMIATGLGFAFPGTIAAQSPYVMIPTDQNGELAGTKVYVAQEVYESLLRDPTAVSTAARVASASYRLRLEGNPEGEISAEVEARFALEDSTDRTETSLPFDTSALRSVMWVTEAGIRPLRWTSEGESSVRLTLPAATNASLLIRAAAVVQSESRVLRRIRFAIPPVATAKLVADSAFPVQRMELAKSYGEWENPSDTSRLAAAIGAIEEIDLSITLRDSARSTTSIAARRYWVHAGYDHTNIECELDPSDASLRKGSVLSFLLQDSRMPLVTTNDWRIQASEAMTSARQLLTVRALRDNPGPIRLLWEMESLITATATAEDPVPIIIPEIAASATAVSPPAMIALSAAAGLRLIAQGAVAESQVGSSRPLVTESFVGPPLAPRITTTTQPDAIDAFISSWKGFRASATEIVTSSSPLVRLVIASGPRKSWHADEAHHLHVRPGELQLSYNATITPGNRLAGPLRLVVPINADLRVLTVNGKSVNQIAQRIGNRDEICLPEAASEDIIRLRAVVHLRTATSGRFSPPRISLEPIQSATGSYTLSRDQSLLIEQIVDGGLVEAEATLLSNAEQLVGGWIPCWTWRLGDTQGGENSLRSSSAEGAGKPQLPGVFRIEPRNLTIESQQRNSLLWQQSRWAIESLIRLRAVPSDPSKNVASDNTIDFVNVEIPTLWCDNLTVEPAEAWSRQPSIDPAIQVIRIRPDRVPDADGQISFRVQGRRSIESDARIEVPLVRVIGSSKRETYITVPQQVDGRSLEWKSSAAINAKLPEGLDEQAPPGMVFRSVGGNSSIRLEPTAIEATNPQVTVADFQVFVAADQSRHLICRWDLSPGPLDVVNIKIPANLEPLDALVGGEPAAWTQNDGFIQIELPLSRLAQGVVLVAKSMTPALSVESPLPTLVNPVAQQSWVTIYTPSTSATARVSLTSDGPWTQAGESARCLALAQSVQTATEESLERASDRSADEVAQWLGTWISRFDRLQAEADVQGDAADQATSDAWSRLDERWHRYLQRLIGEPSQPTVSAFESSLVPNGQWTVSKVARATGQPASLPMIRTVVVTPALSRMIRGMLTLIVAVGLALLLWRVRPWVAAIANFPAAWLLMTGLASFAVAPPPVAIAICVVAVTIPLLTPENQQRFLIARSRSR